MMLKNKVALVTGGTSGIGREQIAFAAGKVVFSGRRGRTRNFCNDSRDGIGVFVCAIGCIE